MGMFDSLYDANGNEFQTKAFECLLTEYHIGDDVDAMLFTYQVEIFGGPNNEDSYATVVDGTIIAIDVPRDETFTLINYYGHVMSRGKR
jgi:hypothetical protein